MLQTYTKQITLYPMQRFLWPGGWQLLFFMYIFTRLVNLHKKFGWEITAQCLLAWWYRYKTKLEYHHDYSRSILSITLLKYAVRVLSRWNANPVSLHTDLYNQISAHWLRWPRLSEWKCINKMHIPCTGTEAIFLWLVIMLLSNAVSILLSDSFAKRPR